MEDFANLRWGLVPFWSKDLKIGARMINARSETASSKPAFRAAFKSRRCLVLADGFYEWKKVGTQKQPFYITRQDDLPFCMAGLWESWRDKKAEEDSKTNTEEETTPVETCTILTTAANEFMSDLHDRMPVILPEDQFDFWLDRSFKDKEKLESILVPCPEGDLKAMPVSTMVNKPANDRPECIEPIEGQQDLF